MRSKTDRVMCGTCEYWAGNREPIFDQYGNPKINILDKTAPCNKQDCKFADQIRDCQKSCCRYSKWTEIL